MLIIRLLDQLNIYRLLGIFLACLYLIGIFQFGFQKILWQVIPPILATVISGAIFDYLEDKKLELPITPFVSGMIIGLVAQFGETPLKLGLIGIAAMTIKFCLVLKGRRLFNPAASGLFLGMIFLSSYPSWWGGSSLPLVFLIWIPVLLYKLKRWAPIVVFLAILTLFNGAGILTSGSLLFFSFVMLIEPITSPYKTKSGLVYGFIVALGYMIISKFFNTDPLIPSLLLGNLTNRVLSRYIN